MKWKCPLGASLASLLLWSAGAEAQVAPQPINIVPTQPAQLVPLPPGAGEPVPENIQVPVPGSVPVPVPVPAPVAAPEAPPSMGSRGLESESLPREIAEDIYQPTTPPAGLGPTPVSEVRILMDNLRLGDLFGDSHIRSFGWVEGGHSGASTGTGLLSVQPRQNRFGNEFLLNQIGLVLQRPLMQDRFDIGFNIRYFAGADAALGQPKGGIGDPVSNQKFSQDFRDLYISAHLPILTEGGMDVKVGRMNTIIGYNGFLAPYRPFYSSDYQFFYSQDGAFTGFLTNLHLNSRLDIWNGMTFGANTFFTKRSSNSICYIGQINYWLTDEQRTRLTASIYCGPNAIFAAPGLAGTFDTTLEFRIQHKWSDYFTQVVQSNMGWDANTPLGTGAWYGVYLINILHASSTVDLISRVEWFKDVQGTRTGIASNYSEVTLGLNWHPTKCLEIRPEIRGDFANDPVFGANGTHRDRNQLTGGISALVKF